MKQWFLIFSFGLVYLAFAQLWQVKDFAIEDSLKQSSPHVFDTTDFIFGVHYFTYHHISRVQLASGFNWKKRWKGYLFSFQPYLITQTNAENPFYLRSTLPMGGGIALDAKHQVVFRPIFKIEKKLNTYFRTGIAYGHEHFGYGYRSFLPSQQAPIYPYVFLHVFLKHFQYTYQINYGNQREAGVMYNKFTVLQYARWEALRWLKLSFFESLTWVPTQNNHMHVVELAYLQPFAFFRPVDYSLGSPANMVMGGETEIMLNKYSLYLQLVLDEFYISEYKNEIRHLLHPKDTTIPTGAWVNKQAMQLGIKSKELFGIQGLGLLTEINIARPYIYSHVFPELSYSHQHQPITHPFGANFYEGVFWLGYSRNRNEVVLGQSFAQIGMDKDSTHVGQNILISTFNGYRGNNIPVPTYGNTIAQGTKTTLWTMVLYWTHRFKAFHLPLKTFVGIGLQKNSFNDKQYHPFFSVGILHNITRPDLLNF